MINNLTGHPIVAGVDGSASALRAAVWAANEAALRHIPLRLAHAINVSAISYLSNTEALESKGRQYLAEAEAAVRVSHPEVNIEVDLRHANPVPSLVDLSRLARLVVVGSRGRGGFSGILAGSTAVGLVTHSHCPVAVIRGPAPGEAPPDQGPVVVGVDGSPASEAAIALAFDEASIRNADLLAVHTWLDFSGEYSYAYGYQFLIDWDRIEIEEQELLAQRLAGWQEKYPDVTVQRVVTQDRPVHHLRKQAAHAQLLVVGSRGRGGISGMLLGSTSQALIYYAPCPLLVARPVTMR
jgi:nucleotide-binding universal stress UspA family protein